MGKSCLPKAMSSCLLPASSGARPLIDGEGLARMKRGAYLINPSRPQLVDSEAALQAVLCGQLCGLWRG